MENLKHEVPDLQDSEAYKTDPNLIHPVAQYKLIKRFVAGGADSWPEKIESDKNSAYINNLLFKKHVMDAKVGSIWPENEDLTGAAEALVRLQNTYAINVKDMADGKIMKVGPKNETKELDFEAEISQNHENSDKTNLNSRQGLSPQDCYAIGRVAYTNGDYYHTINWMTEAKNRFFDNKNYVIEPADFDMLWKTFDHLAFSYSKYNLWKSAYDAIILAKKYISKGDAEFPRIDSNLQYYKNKFQTLPKTRGDTSHIDSDFSYKVFGDANKIIERGNVREELLVYEKQCREKNLHDTLDREQVDKLKCYYWTQMGNPKLILKPFKIELLNIKPTYTLFHDFVSKEESETIESIALPKLNRATIQDPTTGKFVSAKYRIQKTGWLKEAEHDLVGKINQRISDATGLSMETAEELQIGSYGMGGQQ